MNREERGAALVEFALVLPLLLVTFAGIVDFGFAFQRYEVITNAAREGARLASLPGYGDPAIIKSRVHAYVRDGLSLSDATTYVVLPDSDISVTNPDLVLDLGGGASVTVPTARVDAFYHHQFLLLGPMLSLINKSWAQSITLKGSSQMRVEVTGAGS
jgi:hypothetical protein